MRGWFDAIGLITIAPHGTVVLLHLNRKKQGNDQQAHQRKKAKKISIVLLHTKWRIRGSQF